MTGFAGRQIPRDILARVRNVLLIHKPGQQSPQSVINDGYYPATQGAKRVAIIPQKVMIAQDRAVQADGCSERSQWFTASAPGELDLSRGGTGGAPPGFEFDIRGNNDREVRHAGRDGQSVSFEAWTRGRGSDTFGVCLGAEGSNVSIDVYAWIKTTKP
jgi:hypothetical protein